MGRPLVTRDERLRMLREQRVIVEAELIVHLEYCRVLLVARWLW